MNKRLTDLQNKPYWYFKGKDNKCKEIYPCISNITNVND